MAESPMLSRRRYDTDLTDADWSEIEALVPTPQAWPNLQEPKHTAREMLNAIRYRTRTGVAWRALPHDFPPWQTVARRFHTWIAAGVFDAIHDHLRARVRVAEGRKEEPTAAILDSQSVKSTDVGGPCGFDAGKKVKGRKRHLLVDMLGLLLVVLITPASVQDRDGGATVLREAHREYPTLEHVWVDGAYNGYPIEAVRNDTGIRVEMVKRSDDVKGFVVLPRRWVVERTNGWLGKFRILSKEYERLAATSRADVLLAMTSIMLNRLHAPFEDRKERRGSV
ncbi:MAG: IS5 family transposase [Polyangiales bacterium]